MNICRVISSYKFGRLQPAKKHDRWNFMKFASANKYLQAFVLKLHEICLNQQVHVTSSLWLLYEKLTNYDVWKFHLFPTWNKGKYMLPWNDRWNLQLLWMTLFSWVPIFVDWAKITHSWGLKFVVKAFSFIIHTESYFFKGTRFRGSDPPRKPRKLIPHENQAIHSTLKFKTFT